MQWCACIDLDRSELDEKLAKIDENDPGYDYKQETLTREFLESQFIPGRLVIPEALSVLAKVK